MKGYLNCKDSIRRQILSDPLDTLYYSPYGVCAGLLVDIYDICSQCRIYAGDRDFRVLHLQALSDYSSRSNITIRNETCFKTCVGSNAGLLSFCREVVET